MPLTSIAQAQARLATVVGATALLAAAMALALAITIARRMTQPLLDLRTMAARLAGGELTVQVPIPPDEEVAALAQDFNVMASRLRQQGREEQQAAQHQGSTGAEHGEKQPPESGRALGPAGGNVPARTL